MGVRSWRVGVETALGKVGHTVNLWKTDQLNLSEKAIP